MCDKAKDLIHLVVCHEVNYSYLIFTVCFNPRPVLRLSRIALIFYPSKRKTYVGIHWVSALLKRSPLTSPLGSHFSNAAYIYFNCPKRERQQETSLPWVNITDHGEGSIRQTFITFDSHWNKASIKVIESFLGDLKNYLSIKLLKKLNLVWRSSILLLWHQELLQPRSTKWVGDWSFCRQFSQDM